MYKYKLIWIITACLALTSCATASFSKYKGVGRIKRYEIYSEQVPDSFNGFRIAFASDFHYESRFDAKRLHGAIRALQAADADVLLLGGDYRGRAGGDMEELFSALAQVKTRFGTYAVMGNHERGESDTLVRRAMAHTKRIHPDMRYPQSVRPETERRIAYPCASCGRLCGNAGTYPRLCGRHGRIEHRPCLGRTYAWRTSQPVPPVESCTLLQIREPLPHGTEAQQPGHPPHHHQRAGHLAERHPPLHAQRSGSVVVVELKQQFPKPSK